MVKVILFAPEKLKVIKPREEEREETEPVAEEEVSEEVEEREELMSEILGLLEDNSDGLRMVEIAETLGIENWRSLIPVMRDLHDNGRVTKEDSTYYAV